MRDIRVRKRETETERQIERGGVGGRMGCRGSVR